MSQGWDAGARDFSLYDCLDLSALEARLLGLLLRPRVYRLVRATRVHRAFTADSKSLLEVDGSVLVLEARATILARSSAAAAR